MRTLFDIMREAQGGAGLGHLAHRFGLDPSATQAALDALLPAFSLALQRSAQNPALFAELLQSILSGAYAPFFDGAGAPGRGAGQDVVARLFGSPEAATAVAARASEMTGIGLKVVQDMMPVVAATLIGGMLRYATAEGFADLLRQWADVLRTVADKTHPPPPPRPPADPWSAWFDMIARMGGPAGVPAPRPPENPFLSPFDAWSRALGGWGARPATAPAGQPAGVNPFESLSRLFETGREVQAQYLAGLQAILSATTGPGRA